MSTFDEIRLVYQVLMVVLSVIFIVNTIVFVLLRNNCHIKSRGPFMVLLSETCGYIGMMATMAIIALPQINCIVVVWIMSTSLTGFLSSLLGRSLGLITKAYVNYLGHQNCMDNLSSSTSMHSIASLNELAKKAASWKTSLAIIVISYVILIPFQYYMLASAPPDLTTLEVCALLRSSLPGFVSIFVYSYVLFPLALWMMFKLKISHPIRLEIIVSAVALMLSAAMSLIWGSVVAKLAPVATLYFQQINWIIIAGLIIWGINMAMPTIRALRSQQRRCSNCEVGFMDCMTDRKLFELMVQVSYELLSMENTSFVTALKRLRRKAKRPHSTICSSRSPTSTQVHLDSTSTEHVRAWQMEAHTIYTNYVKPGATYELNLTDEVRRKLTKLFETEGETIPEDCFDEAEREVHEILISNIYPVVIQKLKSQQ
ncbi:uncharacterized protein BJ171DRAFT_487011 [Polychytrium aggregatum]|uniref:uncharacterized protein n=1 Tax=Polychytrium aggregatum TaxID=110093 RepID=UPI0022FE89BF|nr:uncharacterized protein BJ171DRAFT_487011 [Polychytrium aggregatum]KAI9209447.1 hypothetical protein BJ171DRAFT_487011 [Polychytrium aggregatum]